MKTLFALMLQMAKEVRFRNYIPNDEELLEQQGEVAVVPEVEKEAEEITRQALEKVSALAEEVELVPKTAHWDLKRELEPKLKTLESMTQRAIAELIHRQQQETQE
jgi:hypothetical protein